MQSLGREHWSALLRGLGPERCCSLQARHVIGTGHGRLWVDRWPAPRAVAGFTGGNLGLEGDPAAVAPADLARVIDSLLPGWERVFVDVGAGFEEPLRAGVPGLMLWPRVVYAQRGEPVAAAAVPGTVVRPLDARDAAALAVLPEDIAWIADTHDGPESLATSGHAVGAFVDGRLASVAAVFYAGETYEEIGVVTEEAQRGRGLSARCSAALAAAIRERGRTPCWSTTPDNGPSMRVAEKLGFVREAEARHFLAGKPVTGALPLD